MARYEIRSAGVAEGPAQGNPADAHFQLGLMYCAGRDVELDLVQAHKWFNIAALRGNPEAKRYRSEIAGEMTRAEVSRAQRLAREWLSRH